MDDLQFQIMADTALTRIEEAIEQEDDGTLDVELLEGVMTITLPDDSAIVINKHLPTKQLWMASSKKGASHWHYDDSSDGWVNSSGSDLFETLANELEESTGISLEI